MIHTSPAPLLYGEFDAAKAAALAEKLAYPHQSVRNCVEADVRQVEEAKRVRKLLRKIDHALRPNMPTPARTVITAQNAADSRQRKGLGYHVDVRTVNPRSTHPTIEPISWGIGYSAYAPRFVVGQVDFGPAQAEVGPAPTEDTYIPRWLLVDHYEAAKLCIDEALRTGNATLTSFEDPGSVVLGAAGSIHFAVEAPPAPPFTDDYRLAIEHFFN